MESAGELEELRLPGCDFARGYYWPVPGGLAEEMGKVPTGRFGS